MPPSITDHVGVELAMLPLPSVLHALATVIFPDDERRLRKSLQDSLTNGGREMSPEVCMIEGVDESVSDE